MENLFANIFSFISHIFYIAIFYAFPRISPPPFCDNWIRKTASDLHILKTGKNLVKRDYHTNKFFKTKSSRFTTSWQSNSNLQQVENPEYWIIHFVNMCLLTSSLHWLILGFLYAFFVQWSIFATFYPIPSPPPPRSYLTRPHAFWGLQCFFLRLSHTNLQTVFFSFVCYWKTLQFSRSK